MNAPLLHVHVVARGIDERMSVPIDRTLALGRDAECDVALPSATVSRRHLSLFVRDGRLLVRDHSSNGTRVNGERLHLAVRELEQRAALEVGPYSIGVRLGEDAVAPAADVDRRARTLEELPCESTPALRVLERFESPEPPRLETTPGPAAPPRDGALGPLAVWLADDQVSELVLGDGLALFAERAGVRLQAGSFVDAAAASAAVARLLERASYVDERHGGVADVARCEGFLMHAVSPPFSETGPRFHLRRIAKVAPSFTTLADDGVCTPAVASLLSGAVRARRNVFVVGQRAHDRATLLQALCSAVPAGERVVCITRDGQSIAPAACQVVTLRREPAVLGASLEPVHAQDVLCAAREFEPSFVVLDEVGAADARAWLAVMNEHSCLAQLAASCPREASANFEHWCAVGPGALSRALVREELSARAPLFVQVGRGAGRVLRVLRISELERTRRGLGLRDTYRWEQGNLKAVIAAEEPGEAP